MYINLSVLLYGFQIHVVLGLKIVHSLIDRLEHFDRFTLFFYRCVFHLELMLVWEGMLAIVSYWHSVPCLPTPYHRGWKAKKEALQTLKVTRLPEQVRFCQQFVFSHSLEQASFFPQEFFVATRLYILVSVNCLTGLRKCWWQL